MQRTAVFILAVLVYAICGSSCGGVKGLQYVQGEFDTTKLKNIVYKEPTIQKGDMISVRIFSDDPASTAAVTSQLVAAEPATELNTSGATPPNAGNLPGFLVDQSGNIRLYKLGVIHVEGMTRAQLGDTLARRYEREGLLKNPFAEVRFINYKITLVGEVAKPGVYTVPAERLSVFEAVGLAGDITNYGRRDNVLVVREINGEREFGKLDLSKPDVFLSPYYYLQQNDMIIVDVRKNKAVENDQITTRNITIAASILSTIAIFINVFRR